MPKTQISCPRCRTPMTAEIQQLFDVNTDPQAKQKLLNGSANMIQCPSCGFQGLYPTPIVYHDPEKELLLTYFPQELAVPVNQQERMVGPLINKAVNDLAMEKRKAYLFQAKSMFTYQTLIETILEADGISKQMLEDQQKRMFLIQRLISTVNVDSRKEIIHQEESLIDETFFALVNRLVEASLMEGDKQSAQQLAIFQKELLEETEVGRKIQEQMKDSQKAVDDLQNLAKQGLTREKLLTLFIDSPSEVYSSTLVGMTRTGIDYEFFTLITQKIDSTSDQDQKSKLIALREYLTNAIKQIDEQIQIEMANAREMVEKIVSAPTIEMGLQQYGNQVNEFFVEAVQNALSDARKNSDLNKLAKLNQLNTMIEEANKPPESIQFIEELLKTEDESTIKEILNKNIEKVGDEFLQMLAGVISQSEEQGNQPQLVEKLKQIQKVALRVSMAKNLQA
ncbi:MAG: hypothetical protein CVU46_05655 [Chloroflexi bacterium HGW-Chloroflexi-8]|nr:MAG: hypothetical protein CVU46_05655 [Chloroflexi bacterium HGW-Chloroflexi-8]